MKVPTLGPRPYYCLFSFGFKFSGSELGDVLKIFPDCAQPVGSEGKQIASIERVKIHILVLITLETFSLLPCLL